MQNLVWFQTTSNFDGEYSEWMKVFEIGQEPDLQRFLPRLAKKFRELWSTNYEGLEATEINFLEDHISAP